MYVGPPTIFSPSQCRDRVDVGDVHPAHTVRVGKFLASNRTRQLVCTSTILVYSRRFPTQFPTSGTPIVYLGIMLFSSTNPEAQPRRLLSYIDSISQGEAPIPSLFRVLPGRPELRRGTPLLPFQERKNARRERE